MGICNKCKSNGVQFDKLYDPHEFIEGKPTAHIWIVGLNPAHKDGIDKTITTSNLANYFQEHKKLHRYFNSFRSVSNTVFSGFGETYGTAHTDIIKCGSPSYDKKTAPVLIENCAPYLQQQIKTYKPRIIVCNGVDASNFFKINYKPNDDESNSDTSFWTNDREY